MITVQQASAPLRTTAAKKTSGVGSFAERLKMRKEPRIVRKTTRVTISIARTIDWKTLESDSGAKNVAKIARRFTTKAGRDSPCAQNRWLNGRSERMTAWKHK
jgi:hypothetical protein